MNTTQDNPNAARSPSTYIKSLYRFALMCGGLCLALAVTAVVTIGINGHSLSVPVAALWVGMSILFMFLGGVSLLWAVLADRKFRALKSGSGWRAALLLLAPCAAYAVQVSSHPATFTIAVHNDTPDVLSSARIGGACCATQLGDIAPHQARKAILKISDDGSFNLDYSLNGHTHSVRIDSYLGIGQNGKQDITVKADGTVDGVR